MGARRGGASDEAWTTSGDGCPSLETFEEALGAISEPSDGRATDADGREAPAIAAIRTHLVRCVACRRRLDEMRRANAFIARFATTGEASASSSPIAAGPLVAERVPTHDLFPGYEIREIVAVGGQGVVYRAVQTATVRTVAIKVPVGDAVRRPAKRYRFRREVELTARLRHPAIVDVLGVCESGDGRIGCVMEFVEGVRFDEWSAARRTEGRDGVRRIVEAMRQIASAIAHAHQSAVLHRDIKPGNIVVDGAGAPRVLDFGLAKAIDDRSASFATVTGAFVGTLAFAAPEQIGDSGDGADVRTDVHGLGALLYSALAGAPPWDVEATTEELLRSIRESSPPRPTRHLASSDPELDAIVLRAMAKTRSRRYQSALEFADDLGRWLDGAAVRARFDSRWYVFRKTMWRKRRVVGALAALAIVAVTVTGMAIESRAARHRGEIERERADAEALRSLAIAEVMRSVAPRGDLVRGDEFARRLGQGLGTLGTRLELGTYADDPAYEAALRMTVGSLVAGTPMLAGNGELYVRKALLARKGKFGADHPEVATGHHDLAEVLLTRQRYSEALVQATEAVEIRARHFGVAHPLTASSLELRARARLRLSDVSGAMEDIRRAAAGAPLEMTATTTTPAPPALRTAIGRTLAETRDAMNEPDAAWNAAVASLELALGHLVDDHPLVARVLGTAGEIAAHQHGALPESPLRGVAATWSELAAELNALDEWLSGRAVVDSTGALLRESQMMGRLVALRRAVLGEEHLAVGIGLACLAHQHAVATEHSLAVDRYLEALPILRARLGPTHAAVASTHSQVAMALAAVGRIAESVHHTRAAIEGLESQLDAERDEQLIAVAYGYLVRYELYAGFDDAALRSGREAMARMERIVGREHHTHALAQMHTAWALSACGWQDEAERLARDAWRVVCASPATPADQFLANQAAYGIVLCRSGAGDEGRPHLRSSLARLLPEFDDGRLDRFVEALAESHRESGESAEAEQVLAWRTSIRGAGQSAVGIFGGSPSGVGDR